MNVVYFSEDPEATGVIPQILRDLLNHQVEERSIEEILISIEGSVSFTPNLYFLDTTTMLTGRHLLMVRTLVPSGIPVVVLTIRTDSQEFVWAGAAKAMTKPIDINQLQELITL